MSKYNGVSLFGEFLRLPLRLIPPEAEMRVMLGPLRGMKWIAGSSDHGCWIGWFEREKANAMSRAVKPGMVVYDLGANMGYYSLLAGSRVGPSGKVFCFEPAHEPGSVLRRHLESNNMSNCTIIARAVGDRDGIARFAAGSSNSTGRLTDGPGYEVQVSRLDTLIEEGVLPPPDLIKCDIEGAEGAALEGGKRMLAIHKPVLYLATHGQDVHTRCCRLLGNLGYTLQPLDGKPIAQSCEIVAVAG